MVPVARQQSVRNSHLSVRRLLVATALAGTLAGPAFAQDQLSPAPAEAAPAASEEIIVTGSRAAQQQGFSAPTPTQVIGADLISRQGAATVAQVLYQNPAFKASRSPGSNAGNVSNPGQATTDLRALGGQRTLVLFNGSRIVPQAPASNLGVPVATDTNLIPTMMIDRVEVVTGGASAQYGSDAVAGVVNILVKRKMEGIRLTAQGGISQYGDNGNYRVGALGGFGFADGRGQVIGSVEYSQSNEMQGIAERDWGREQWQVVSNAAFATNGQPAQILAPNVRSVHGVGGVITGPANFSLNGRTFNADGTTRPFQYGTIRNATLQIGGEGPPFGQGDLVPGVKRFTAYARGQYELSDAATVFLEGGYSRSRGRFNNNIASFTGLTIRNDNAFLPAAVRSAMAAQGVTSFTFTKIAEEIGLNQYDVYNATPHGSIGIEGRLGGGWRYDAHYSYGVNNYRQEVSNNLVTPNTNFAVDAVVNPANGQIVCRATLPGASFNPAAAGCVPINLFGPGNTSPAARAYVAQSGTSTAKYRQHAAAANLRGEPFSTWAGPVALAFGVEYRRESTVVKADPIAAVNGFTASGNASPFSGHFEVKEGYVETIVPIARDLSFAHSIDLNGAIRYADYDTVGGQTTWKVGAVYAPVDGLRLRATRSRDIRAPALWELFSAGSEVTNAVTVRGQSPRIPQNSTKGNPNLDPEKGDTWTVGAVIEPTEGALRGLRLSVDYYDIKLKGAITSLTAANIGTLCTLGNQQFCSYFTFDAAGVPTRLVAPVLNLGSFQNRGIDAALAYSLPMPALGTGGRLAINFTGTYVTDALVNTGVPGQAAVDRAGENGQQNLGAIPRFRGNLSTTFSGSDWSLTAQLLYISKGKLDNSYNTTPSLTINDNSIPAVAYVNLYGTLNVSQDMDLFMSVSNLLNRDPPVSPYPILNTPVNGQYYDKVGRAFQVGVNLKF